MKQIIISVILAASATAFAHDTGYRHEHERGFRQPPHVVVPDRVERRVIFRDGQRIVIDVTYRCVEQRRARCLEWKKINVDHEVDHRRERRGDRNHR